MDPVVCETRVYRFLLTPFELIKWANTSVLTVYTRLLSASERKKFLSSVRARVAQAYEADRTGRIVFVLPVRHVIAFKT